jgi:hypothetical protein
MQHHHDGRPLRFGSGSALALRSGLNPRTIPEPLASNTRAEGEIMTLGYCSASPRACAGAKPMQRPIAGHRAPTARRVKRPEKSPTNPTPPTLRAVQTHANRAPASTIKLRYRVHPRKARRSVRGGCPNVEPRTVLSGSPYRTPERPPGFALWAVKRRQARYELPLISPIHRYGDGKRAATRPAPPVWRGGALRYCVGAAGHLSELGCPR